MKIYIDSSCDILYSSFYIHGLYQIFGRKHVKFSSKYFKQFRHNNHFFAFVAIEGSSTKRIIIDFTDSKVIDPVALDWCDVYGKINLDLDYKPNDKLIAIGPSFGIQIYGVLETLWLGFSNLLKSSSRIPKVRKFLSDYKAQYKRSKISDYQHISPIKNYIFFIASLWKQEAATNTLRANFIKSCQSNSAIHFEGGFAPRTKNDITGFESITTSSRIDMSDYIKKISQSLLVFNTPAVKGCHGWKLAEYLCLGKVILSTPLSRQMPNALEDHKHVIYTTGELLDLSKKTNHILNDSKLREYLEVNSRAYFLNYLSPEAVIKSLVNRLY